MAVASAVQPRAVRTHSRVQQAYQALHVIFTVAPILAGMDKFTNFLVDWTQYVSPLVASLLPIMWSHSTGAEVMKPLATPVLGGMVSSLGLVLIVTPVIFYWLRERELRRAEAERRLEERATHERPALGSAE